MALPARWIHEQQSVGQGVRGDVFTTDFDVESSEIGPRYLRGGWVHLECDHLQAGMCESPRVHADAAAGIDHRADAGRGDSARPPHRHFGWTGLLHAVDGHQLQRVVGGPVPRLGQGSGQTIPVEPRHNRTRAKGVDADQ